MFRGSFYNKEEEDSEMCNSEGCSEGMNIVEGLNSLASLSSGTRIHVLTL